MQPDRRLVQDIGHPHQPGTDLRRQPDALCFSAGKRPGRPGEGEIIQPDLIQKSHARPDFPYNLISDQVLLARQPHIIIHKVLQIPHGHGRHLINVFVTDRHRQRLLFQPLPFACVTGRNAHKLFIFLFHHLRGRLPVLALYISQKSFKRHIVHTLAAHTFIMHFQLFSVRAVNKNTADFFRVFPVGRLQRKVIFLRQGL